MDDMVWDGLFSGLVFSGCFRVVDLALNQVAKPWFHQYLDPAKGSICGFRSIDTIHRYQTLENVYQVIQAVTFSSPKRWRSLNPLKGSRFHHPKKATTWITRQGTNLQPFHRFWWWELSDKNWWNENRLWMQNFGPFFWGDELHMFAYLFPNKQTVAKPKNSEVRFLVTGSFCWENPPTVY